MAPVGEFIPQEIRGIDPGRVRKSTWKKPLVAYEIQGLAIGKWLAVQTIPTTLPTIVSDGDQSRLDDVTTTGWALIYSSGARFHDICQYLRNPGVLASPDC